MRAKPWLIALAVLAASCAGLLGVVGPRLVRVGRSFYEPVSKMKSEQQEFEKWSREQAWTEPAEPALTAEQLDGFLRLRKLLLELEARTETIAKDLPQDRRPSLDELSGMMDGVGGLVTRQLSAHREHGMTPREYQYLKTLVYRVWLPALTAKGEDPGAVLAAAREIDAAAEEEASAAVRQRLGQLARSLRERRPRPPDGVPAAVHELLLSRVAEIRALLGPGLTSPPRR